MTVKRDAIITDLPPSQHDTDMKWHLLIQILPFLSFFTSIRADVVHHLDAVALGRLGTATNSCGWIAENAGNYSDSYKYALRFEKSTRILSPVYPTPIKRIELKVVSSAQSDRQLAVIPLRKANPLAELTYLCDYTPSKNIFSLQEVCWSPTNDIRQVQLGLVGAGRTGWGLLFLDVFLADPKPLSIHVR